MKLSIIIINWNTDKLLKQCLKSVVHSVHSSMFPLRPRLASTQARSEASDIQTEIIIIDNGSRDKSVKEIRKLKFDPPNHRIKLKIIENKVNLGFAKANNIGIKQALGKYIFLLNSDTIVKEDAIEKLVEFLNGNSNVAVSPLLLLPNHKPQNEYYMKFPNLWQVFLYHNPILRPLVMKIPFLKPLVAQKTRDNFFEADQLPGAGIMMSREVWDKVGLLDEDYHFLFEDVDWCWRAKEKGVKLMVVPEAEIIHMGGASWVKKKKQDKNGFYYQFFCSMLLFVRKNYGRQKGKVFKWAIIANFILTFKIKLALVFYKNNGKQLNFL